MNTSKSYMSASSVAYSKEDFDQLQKEADQLRSQNITLQAKVDIQREKLIVLENMLLEPYRRESGPTHLRVVR